MLTKVAKYVIIAVGRNARRSYLKMVAVGFLNYFYEEVTIFFAFLEGGRW